jgi:3-oxoisoapionate decarboxylase
MKLGIGTYACMWSIGLPGAQPSNPMDAYAFLTKAKELGLSLVQFGPNLPLDHLHDSDLARLFDYAQRSGIQIECGTRTLEPSHLRKQISLAHRLGASLLRTVPDFEVGAAPSPRELAATLAVILPDLEKNQVRLAIENGNIPARDLSELLEILGSPWIGVTLDTANSLAIPEGTQHVVSTLAKYAFSLHVKDFVVSRAWHRMGFLVEGRPAGKGQMNIAWILRELKTAGAEPNAILELWPPQQSSLQATIALEQAWAVESIRYLREFMPV